MIQRMTDGCEIFVKLCEMEFWDPQAVVKFQSKSQRSTQQILPLLPVNLFATKSE